MIQRIAPGALRSWPCYSLAVVRAGRHAKGVIQASNTSASIRLRCDKVLRPSECRVSWEELLEGRFFPASSFFAAAIFKPLALIIHRPWIGSRDPSPRGSAEVKAI